MNVAKMETRTTYDDAGSFQLRPARAIHNGWPFQPSLNLPHPGVLP
jgi:hypothetical protein